MISYFFICSLFSVFALVMLRFSQAHVGLQKALGGLAIILWCLPWPYLANALPTTVIKVIPLSELKSSTVAVAAESAIGASIDIDFYLSNALLILLSIGFAVYCIRVYRHRQYCRKLLKSSCTEQDFKLRYGGQWFRVPSLQTPMLIGLWRPRILLPLNVESKAELELMASHELAHRENCDHWQVAVLGLLQSVFFWNPLMQRLVNKQRNLIEVHCDLRVASENPFVYRHLLSRLALRGNGFDLSCSMAMGNIIWRLKMMERTNTQRLLTWKNITFTSVFVLSLLLSVGSLLGSAQVFAVDKSIQKKSVSRVNSQADGALLNLVIEASKNDSGEIRERSMESNIWVHYDKKAEFILGEDWKLHLTLIKQENDTVFLATQLIDLSADDQVINEPQMLVDLGKEAKIEVGTEQWRYAASFVVTEVPLEELNAEGAD